MNIKRWVLAVVAAVTLIGGGVGLAAYNHSSGGYSSTDGGY